MKSIQIFSGVPAMFVVTCFYYLSIIMSPVVVMKGGINKMYSKYFSVQLWPYHLTVYEFCFYVPQPIRPEFLKGFFSARTFFDFKIDCILVWQLMSLSKKVVVSLGKLIIFISWSPIWTPLILVSASIKLQVLHSRPKWDHLFWFWIGYW